MEPQYWRNKWEKGEIGFHMTEANPALVKHYDNLPLKKNDRVFVPLCGKTLDIAWLLLQGCRVAGAELSEMAIQQLFEELQQKPEITHTGSLKLYSAKKIDMFVGDIFNLTGEMLGPVDAIYDRAAFVALPKQMRNQYTAHLRSITNTAPQLLITYDYEYEEAKKEQPTPFPITESEVKEQYQTSYHITALNKTVLPAALRGKYDLHETVWLLDR